MPMVNNSVAVLGGGILGLTTSIVLKLAGYDVSVYTAKEISDSNATSDPLFASAYPAASVIPHTVRADRLETLVEDSGVTFLALLKAPDSGVRIQRHWELSENELETPDYVDALKDFRRFDDSEIPVRRRGARHVSGYSFDCFFCDMPIYGRWIQKTVQSLGIQVLRTQITHGWKPQNPADYYVNCLGAGAARVFEDLQTGSLVRGILLLAEYTPMDGPISSYNYSPPASVYPSFDEMGASDVYFYPRSEYAVLGGTRQRGQLIENEFVADSTMDVPLIELHGVSVPKPIVDLNAELIEQLTGSTIGKIVHALVGYRHLHVNSDGRDSVALRLANRIGLPPIVDCFGFGGAGVTLSWGAAIRVAELLSRLSSVPAMDSAMLAQTILKYNDGRYQS